MESEKLQDFLHALQRQVEGEVRWDSLSLTLYSTDASIYQVKPYGVLIPRSVQDVQSAIRLASEYQVPILPRGGGTSLAGQTVNEALVIDTTRHLDQIMTINPEEKWARAQTGVVLSTLNARLKPYGLKYGPDPASGNRAVLGGVVGNNASGSHSILYGMSADHVLETRVILSDGSMAAYGPKSPAELSEYEHQSGLEAQIYRQMMALVNDPQHLQSIHAGMPAHWRRCGGYNLERLTDGEGFSFRWPFDPRFNLSKLICGSEGTLAFMTDVTLNLVDLPRQTGLAVVHFDNLRSALEAVPVMLEVSPTAIELMDSYGIALVKQIPYYTRMLDTFLQGNPNCFLITEFYGDSLSEIEGKIQNLHAHLQKRGVRPVAITDVTDTAGIQKVWKVREVSFGILMGMRGDVKPLPVVDDAAVPPEALADYITQLEEFCRQDLDHEIAYFAHASAGCLHVHSLLNAKLAADVAKLPKIVRHAGEMLKEYRGVLSSEHGDGRLRSWLNPFFYGEKLYGLFQQVKQIFDPANLFNPGDIVNAPPMTEGLRYGEAYHAFPLQPFLGFETEQGFDRAIEMCNGAAVCRQLTGTMCPTFVVTREEQHSPRGRANMLRAAISGQVALDAPEVYETLDLCLSCRACKAECPSAVDIAKLKAEYLHQYYQTHPVPLRSNFFTYFGDLSGLAGGAMAPLSNLVLQNRLARGLLDRLLRLAPQRKFPLFSRQTFDEWFARREKPPVDQNQTPVVLMVSVVHNFNHPNVAQAALRVLEACNFTVVVPRVHDLGRAAYSKGNLPVARRKARRAIQALAPFVENGWPIISLEPSDVSMLVEDFLSLLPGDERIRRLAARSLTIEEFLWRELQSGRLQGVFQPQQGEILLHGNCHQKALVGTRYSEDLLASLGYHVEEAGSACCGMAGSFGFEAEHYEMSIQLAEQILLPRIRAQHADTLIVASGISCNKQIEDGSGRKALHPAEVLERALR